MQTQQRYYTTEEYLAQEEIAQFRSEISRSKNCANDGGIN